MKKSELSTFVEEKTGVQLSNIELEIVSLVYNSFLEPKLEAAELLIQQFKIFARKYAQMRQAQKGYFKSKNSLLLEEAKKLEKECDQLIKKLSPVASISSQQQLFK